jgi:hypothetical protein
MGLTTLPHKKLPVRKPEMWPRKSLMEEVHYGGKGLRWAVVPMKKINIEREKFLLNQDIEVLIGKIFSPFVSFVLS